MKNLSEFEKNLMSGPKSNRLREVMASDAGQRLGKSLDPKAVEQVRKSGDIGAMKSLLTQVLSTAEGRELAEKISDIMKD